MKTHLLILAVLLCLLVSEAMGDKMVSTRNNNYLFLSFLYCLTFTVTRDLKTNILLDMKQSDQQTAVASSKDKTRQDITWTKDTNTNTQSVHAME